LAETPVFPANIFMSKSREAYIMVCNQKILLMVALMIGLFCYSYAVAEIVVDPFGFAVSVEE